MLKGRKVRVNVGLRSVSGWSVESESKGVIGDSR